MFGSALEPPSNRSFVSIDSERSLINVKGELRSLHIAIILPFCIFFGGDYLDLLCFLDFFYENGW